METLLGSTPGIGFLVTIANVIRVIFILVDLLLFAGFTYALVEGWRFRPSFDFSKKQVKKTLSLRDAVTRERWQSIIDKFSIGSPDSARLAVIEADALVDGVLKRIGLAGEHLADRLSNLETEELKTVERVWRAHRLRNELVHAPGFSLSPGGAKTALDDYEAFLREIGAL